MQRGGDVKIRINELNRERKGFLPFELVLTMPSEIFVEAELLPVATDVKTIAAR